MPETGLLDRQQITCRSLVRHVRKRRGDERLLCRAVALLSRGSTLNTCRGPGLHALARMHLERGSACALPPVYGFVSSWPASSSGGRTSSSGLATSEVDGFQQTFSEDGNMKLAPS